MNSQRAFTLVEMLVALALFGAVVGIALGYFASAISIQRETLATRPMIDETSFVGEYMSRALRPAQLTEDANCLSEAGIYYESASPEVVRFIDEEGRCREFSHNPTGKKVEERISTDATSANFGALEALTSSGMDVQNLEFKVSSSGATRHPQVTFIIEVLAKGETTARPLRLQTSISQREF